MTELSNKNSNLHLSIYGYGMLSFSTAMIILISQGFFMRHDSDPLLSWGIAIFAGASGALSLAMVRANFPLMEAVATLFSATFLNVFLFGCYFTSYYGYSRLYIMKTNSITLYADAMSNFWPTLTNTWLNTFAAAAACSLAYIIIQRALGGFTHLLSVKT